MNEINILIGIGGVLIGLALNYKNFRRTQDKDIKANTKEDTEVKIKLDYIGKGVDDIRLDMRSTKDDVAALKETVIRVDESTKSAHHRIDEIVKKGDD